jgi:hypothetical protein
VQFAFKTQSENTAERRGDEGGEGEKYRSYHKKKLKAILIYLDLMDNSIFSHKFNF